MREFFHPKSVAIIGASNEKNKIGNILVKNLKTTPTKIFPINPKSEKIESIKSFPSVLDIKESIDLAIIAVPSFIVPKIVEECAWREKPIKNIIIISAGFSESNKKGKCLEEKIKEIALQYDLKIMGPNCLGNINASKNINLSFAKNKINPGNLGLIMQSGAMTTALLDIAISNNFGFSLISTLGNKAGINENDLIEYYLQDKKTDIIAIYLENIANGKKFAEILKKAKKPIVIIRAGISQKAKHAIQSHTGAMVGSIDVFKTILTESGVIFCDSLSDFVNVIRGLLFFQKPKENSIAIVTNAGGPGVMTTDLIEKQKKLTLYVPSKAIKERLKKALPTAASIENPIDVLGDALDDRYRDVFKILSKASSLGSILALITPQAQTPIEKIVKTISNHNKKSKKIIYPVFMGGPSQKKAKEKMKDLHLSNFSFPIDAINAIEKITAARKNVEKEKNQQQQKPTPLKDIILHTKYDQRNVLLYNEVFQLGNFYNLNMAPATQLNDKVDYDEKDFNYPLAMKIDSPTILHKNVKNGVVLNISSKKEAEKIYEKMKKDFSDEKIIIQSQAKDGLEIIMGIKKDPDFGHILMLGMGGITTEIFNQKHLWSLPVNKRNLKNKLENSTLEKLIKKQKISPHLVVEELEKVSQLAIENPEIQQLDINPIIFYKEKRPIIVDMKIILSS